jgi:hypothetical protein
MVRRAFWSCEDNVDCYSSGRDNKSKKHSKGTPAKRHLQDQISRYELLRLFKIKKLDTKPGRTWLRSSIRDLR